jgi:hypothetical protein
LPALRADGVLAPLGKWPDLPASKVVPQDFVFPVLVLRKENEGFFVFRRNVYEAFCPAMATLKPLPSYDKQHRSIKRRFEL